MTNEEKEYRKLEEIVEFLLKIGILLVSSGAHCGRVNRNLRRISIAWDVSIDLNLVFTGLSITAKFKNPKKKQIHLHIYKSIKSYAVNFDVIREISHLSWFILKEKITVEQANKLLKEVKQKKVYNNMLLLIGIGFASVSLCLAAGGDWRDSIFSFLASTIGTMVRLELMKRRVNFIVALFVAAFLTTIITGLNVIGVMNSIWGISANSSAGMATAVLYLVPGVHLINSVIDFFEGYTTSSINRGVYSMFILLSIATAMSISIFIMGANKF